MGRYIWHIFFPLIAVIIGFFAGVPLFANLLILSFTGLVFAELLRVTRFLGNLSIELQIPTNIFQPWNVTSEILDIVRRKNRCVSLNLLDHRIASKEELSRTLERITSLAYQLLYAESVELALFDQDSGTHHSSFVLGMPFRFSAEAMLAEVENPQIFSPGILMEPIAFAGEVRGALRVGLTKGRTPTPTDREIMKLLSVQSTIAIMNSEYSNEILRLKNASDESVKAKTGFLANLSHEIRGPLGIMINAVELVLEGLCGEVSADQTEILSMVRQNGAHLLELMNDVLDYAKVESGKISVSKVDVSVHDLLLDMVKVVRAQSDAKGHEILLTSPEDQLVVSCDKRHLRQMLINLLTNAIKYTPENGKIEVWSDRGPNNKIRIHVRDNGVGIDPNDWKKVFSPFERVDHAYSMKQAGAGIGMPLTQRLVEVNGGNISFDSTPKKGSHFWLTFPSVESSWRLDTAADSLPERINGEGKLLLVVATKDSERNMMERYLKNLRFSLILSDSSTEALDALKKNPVDLLIIENNSLNEFGEGFVRTIRDHSNTPSLPIILVSSRGFSFDVEQFLKAGVDRCLTRPVELSELATTVDQLVSENRRALKERAYRTDPKIRAPIGSRQDPIH